ncbi:MAG TPA: hypothetical protein VGW33_06665 [Terriglobia bacterium]|nr:hypothetical protein [Terriglobia bacterium]
MQTKPEHETAKRHETVDANVRGVVRWGIGVFALLASGLLVSVVVFRYFVTHQGLGPPASPFQNVRALPPAPLLQVAPAADLSHYLNQETETLDTYGWVDQNAGIVRIPIDRAMELLLQKGFPVESHPAARQKAAAPSTQPSGMPANDENSPRRGTETKQTNPTGRGK